MCRKSLVLRCKGVTMCQCDGGNLGVFSGDGQTGLVSSGNYGGIVDGACCVKG